MAVLTSGQITLIDQNDTALIVLTPTSILIPTDATGAFTGSYSTTATVYVGSKLQTTGWVFSKVDGTGVTSTINSSTGVVTVTASTQQYSYIDITATNSSIALTVSIRCQVIQQRQGSNGTNGINGINGTSPLVYDIVTNAPVIVKDAQDASTVGTYTSITIQGKKYDGNTTTNYGWVTVTGNGDVEATTATDTAAAVYTLSPASTSGKSSYTVKMYNQATVSGAILLDTQVISVVFKGAVGTAGPSGKNATLNYASSELWDSITTNTNANAVLGGQFIVNGDGNQRLWRSNYNGFPSLIWASKYNDLANDADGGWDKSIDSLSSQKSYLSFVYFRRVTSSTSGTWYHGCSLNTTLNMDGSTNSNPYFNTIPLSSLEQNVWYVSIGLIHATGTIYASSTGFSGIYRLNTGTKIAVGTDYKRLSGTTTRSHRTYLYYSTDPTTEIEWYWPGFFEINGNEPTLQDLLSTSNISGLNQITATNASTYIANAAIGSAQIGDAAITTAKIGDAAITSAKIENLTVGEDKIASGAITAGSVALANGPVEVSRMSAVNILTWTNAASVNISGIEGRYVSISINFLFYGSASTSLDMRLLRGDTVVWGSTATLYTEASRWFVQASSVANNRTPLSSSCIDILPSDGTHTYTLQLAHPFASGSTQRVYFEKLSMATFILKK